MVTSESASCRMECARIRPKVAGDTRSSRAERKQATAQALPDAAAQFTLKSAG